MVSVSANKKWGLVVFLFALLLRLVYVGEIRSSPYFENLVLDAYEYDRLATQLLSGDWLLETSGFYVHGPLYTYLLALLKACGLGSLGIRLFQALIGALSSSLIFSIAGHVFPRPVPHIAGFMAAAYWPFIFFGGELLATTLFVFLELLLILVLLRWGAVSFYAVVGAALLTALLALTRGNALLLVPLVVWWLWHMANAKSRVRVILLFSLIYALCLTPYLARNYAVQGSLLPFQGSWSFYMGNNPNADGTPYARQGIVWQRLENLPLKEGLETPAQLGTFYRNAALGYMVQNPGAYVKLLYRKFRLFWHQYEIPVSADMRYAEQHSHLAAWTLGFGLLVPLALVGLLSGIWAQKKSQLLVGFILVYLCTGLLFSVCARYRLPALPLLLVFAAGGLWRLWAAVRTPRLLTIGGWGVLLGAAFALVHSGIQRDEVDHLRSPWLLGHIYLQQRQYDRALETYRDGVRQFPGDADIYNGIAVTNEHLGRMDEAEVAYRRAVELAPDFAKAWLNLGKLYLKQKSLKKAQGAFIAALEQDLRPSIQYEANYNLGQCYMVKRIFPQARDAFVQALEHKQGHLAYYNLSAAYNQLGQTKEQLHSLEQAVRLDSSFAPAHRNLGVLYIQRKEYAAAEAALQQAILHDPASPIAYRHLAELYKRMGRADRARAAYEAAQRLSKRF
jgi:tetratricopeptide (TPR) repeat protein